MDSNAENTEKTSIILIIGLALVLIIAIIGGALLAPDALPVFNTTANNTTENTTTENIDYGIVLENTFINESGELVIDWQNATPDDTESTGYTSYVSTNESGSTSIYYATHTGTPDHQDQIRYKDCKVFAEGCAISDTDIKENS